MPARAARPAGRSGGSARHSGCAARKPRPDRRLPRRAASRSRKSAAPRAVRAARRARAGAVAARSRRSSCGLVEPPAGLEVAPPGAAARARRIDQRPRRPCRATAPAPRASRPGLSRMVSTTSAPARSARGASRDRRRAVGVGGDQRALRRASPRPARASCRRRRRRDRSPSRPDCAPTASQASWLPQSWISTRPSAIVGPLLDGGAERKRRPCAVRQRLAPAAAAPASARSALSALTRMSSGARSSSAAASAPAMPEAARRRPSQAGATPPSATARLGSIGAGP